MALTIKHPIDLTLLDEEMEREESEHKAKMARFEKIKEMLATDPKMVDVLKRVLLNGNSAIHSTAESKPSLEGISSAEAHTQISAVRFAISSFGGTPFTVSMIGEALRKGGMDIANIAVGRVLQRLLGYQEIKLHKPGGGNVPNQYVQVEKEENGEPW